MGIISQKLRDSAKGQACTFAIPGICNHDPATTVLCHIRDESKGLSNKANDYSAAFGCHACHDAIDQHRLSKQDELFYSLRGLQRTWDNWVSRGLIVVPQTVSARKPSSKTLPRRHIITGERI
ncbi:MULTISPECIES: nuclease domain-containing protein [unclassified Mesorhizobium]|uniref:nuclease domain-containing protein n=1 Tax=unclassified Mesorhizobium TaxID=325217 RepID=UPI001678251B|nr:MULTISPECIES: nuclease domain-containing protein [unclassified Mesorhizobium]